MNLPTTIPVNIIGGPLGSGKTTTINHLLSQKDPNEYWAILVNEYGLIGIDGALIESNSKQKSVDIKEVAGGCICCSAGVVFEVSLVRLLQRRPDRLLIEPTGLATLSGIIETLNRPGIAESIDLRSMVCLLDPARLKDILHLDTVQDQIEASDILLATHTDLASPELLQEFDGWSADLFPQKIHVEHIVHGQISIDILDKVSNRTHIQTTHAHKHETDHHHHHGHDHHGHEHHSHEHDHHHDHHDHHEQEHQPEMVCDEEHPIVRRVHQSTSESTFGWICWSGLVFDAVEADKWLNRLAKIPGSLRTKAVLRTNEGWWKFNFVSQAETLKPSGYRRDSRIEVIVQGSCEGLVDQFEQELKACLVNEPITS